MSCARPTVVVILGCLCVMPAGAQQDACRQRTIPVSIFTRDGSPEPPLSSANLEASYRKKPVRVTSAVINREPPRIVLLLDASASMLGTQLVHEGNSALDLAEYLLSNMPPATEIGLEIFSKKLVPVSRPTTDRKTLQVQLESLRSNPSSFKGQTALWSAILDSAKMFDHPRMGDAIYVITDGLDNASNITMRSVAQTLGEAGVRLFAFVFQDFGSVRTPEEEVGPVDVQHNVDYTGGTFVAFKIHEPDFPYPGHDPARIDKLGNPAWLGLPLKLQFQQIISFFRVGIDMPETVDKPRELKLDLVGFSKSQRDKLQLAYPHVVVPCH